MNTEADVAIVGWWEVTFVKLMVILGMLVTGSAVAVAMEMSERTARRNVSVLILG